MERKTRVYSEKIMEKLARDGEEREIIRYGLHQGFLILLNAGTTVFCGALWGELPFALLIFLGIFVLRPYAGGYHADTELRCYLLSTGMINAALLAKKMIPLPAVVLAGLWFGTAALIWIYSPVENPIHPLEEDERKKYAGKARRILLCGGALMLAGLWRGLPLLTEGIVWTQVLVVIAMAAGMVKYKTSVHF